MCEQQTACNGKQMQHSKRLSNSFLKQFQERVSLCPLSPALGLLISFTFLLIGFSAVADSSSIEVVTDIPHKEFNAVSSILGGAAAGITRGCSRIFTYPLDTIKARQQVEGFSKRQQADTFTDAPSLATNQTAINSKKNSGIASLFSGSLLVILVVAPTNAAFFFTYDKMERLLLPQIDRLGPSLTHLLASGVATVPANAIKIPAEVVKQRCQTGIGANTFSVVPSIIKEEGLGGFYTGWQSQFARELPFNSLQFVLYEFLKEHPIPFVCFSSSTLLLNAIDGFLASGASAVLTHPIDTIKTRLMTKTGTTEQTGMLEFGQDIVSYEGVSALFSGLLPRVLLVSSGGAIYFWANSAVRILLEPLQ